MGFTYLSSPYTVMDRSLTQEQAAALREKRYRAACKEAANLMRTGVCVFSPIAHSHSIEAAGMTKLRSGEFWKAQDIPLLRHAESVAVLMLDGWEESEGIAWEVAMAGSLRIPIYYLHPGPPITDERNRLEEFSRTAQDVLQAERVALDPLRDGVASFQQRADQLVADAEALGVVVTISLKPLNPLAMGNHQMVADAQPKHPY